MKNSLPLILASASPRRVKLLRQIGIDCTVQPSSVDEQSVKALSPAMLVQQLAFLKANDVSTQHKEALVIGADTIVVLDGKILGKPTSPQDARSTLHSLSGKTHRVYTGFCLLYGETQQCLCSYETTEVTFRKLGELEISEYVTSGSPMDKAGAYGIQDDFGAVFVSRINGDYYTVVGLPLSKLYSALEYFGQ